VRSVRALSTWSAVVPHCPPGPRNTITDGLSDTSWDPPFKRYIWDSKQEAINNVTSAYSNSLIIYSDGSGFEGKVGSAAVTRRDSGEELVRRLHMGKLKHHTVYESEVVGVLLAADIVKEIRPTQDVTILLDNQATIRSLNRRKHHSGQHLVYAAQRNSLHLPGHQHYYCLYPWALRRGRQ
jgi:hypothetical protein